MYKFDDEQSSAALALIATKKTRGGVPDRKNADMLIVFFRRYLSTADSKVAEFILTASQGILPTETSVVVDHTILGKPENDEHARGMLELLSGREHEVLTAVTVLYNKQVLRRLSKSYVTFSVLKLEEIDWYISTGEGRDKAGSYAIQGLAAMFIKDIRGSYSGIMGLPIYETNELLMQISKHRYE